MISLDVRAPLLLVLATALLPLLAAQPDSALVVVHPITSSLNLSAGEVAPLAFVIQNLGGDIAANVTVTLTASGCAQLLSWNGTWEKNLAVSLGDLAPGSAKRLVVQVRCQGERGSIIATAYGDNVDPAFASATVSARSSSEAQPLVLLPLAAVMLVAMTYALARSRKKGKRR